MAEARLRDDNPWLVLYHAHGELRREGVTTLETDIRTRLVRLAKSHGDPHLVRWKYKKLELTVVYELKKMPLQNLEKLTDAKLTLLAHVDLRRQHVNHFALTLEGRGHMGQPWTVAIHLEDNEGKATGDHKGKGAASHAALHCHVGPDLDHEPKVRVPLPPLSMAHCLDWLLCMVIPEWEPAPWASIKEALAPTTPA